MQEQDLTLRYVLVMFTHIIDLMPWIKKSGCISIYKYDKRELKSDRLHRM